MIKSIAAGIKKAKSTDTEKLVAAFKGLQVDTPFGKITYRAEDHQSTMGAFVGKTKNEGGKGVMVDYQLPRRRQVPAERRRSRASKKLRPHSRAERSTAAWLRGPQLRAQWELCDLR